MKDFFRVSHDGGADLCEIKQDTKGQYLADCIQRCAPGVLLRIEKVHKARLGKAVSNESPIIKIVAPPGKSLGIDFKMGEVYKVASLRTQFSESSDQDVEIGISSTHALKLITGDLSVVVPLIALTNETYIGREFVALEFNGLVFHVERIAELQSVEDLLLQKGQSISLALLSKRSS